MATDNSAVMAAWERHDGPAVLVTVDEDGTPNAIYVSDVKVYGDGKLAVADAYFHKTRDNVRRGGKASLLFITRDGESWQIKGEVEYHTSGAVYEDICRNWILPFEPAAAVVLNAREVRRFQLR